MERIKIYKPPDGPAPAAEFIDGLEPKLRDKVVRQILYLSWTPLPGVEGAPDRKSTRLNSSHRN